MKDQYVGDINDYWKYALLRSFSNAHSARVSICWMLTAPDGRSDGARLGYLTEENAPIAVDPPLFRMLGGLVAAGERTVKAVEDAGLVRGATYHRDLLEDTIEDRKKYFGALWSHVSAGDLVFFDPDNGLEVPSVKKGRRNSSKYVYWDEVRQTLELDCSVVVYQHFPRVARPPFLAVLLDRLGELRHQRTFAVASSSVGYLCCFPHEQSGPMERAARAIVQRSDRRLALYQGRL